MTVRPAEPADWPDILALYPRAFVDEDLSAIVTALRDAPPTNLSFTARAGGRIIGHIAFTHCDVAGHPVAMLAPLAVDPDHQKTGVGSALVAAGHERLAQAGVSHVLVLGDPAYYGRFGFAQEDGIKPPHDIPAQWHPAWQSLALDPSTSPPAGALNVPAFWRDPALWLP